MWEPTSGVGELIENEWEATMQPFALVRSAVLLLAYLSWDRVYDVRDDRRQHLRHEKASASALSLLQT